MKCFQGETEKPWVNSAKLLYVAIEHAKRCTQDKAGFTALIDRVFVVNATPS